jgi:hypothetical protein
VALVRPFGSPFTARDQDRHPEMASDLVWWAQLGSHQCPSHVGLCRLTPICVGSP